MLLNSFANISLGLLNSFPVSDATRQRRAVGEIPDIFCFFFGDDFEGIVSHLSRSFESEAYHKHCLSPFVFHFHNFLLLLTPAVSPERIVELINLTIVDDPWNDPTCANWFALPCQIGTCTDVLLPKWRAISSTLT
jgi:hypothetical protein